MSIHTYSYTCIHSYPNLHTCTHYTCLYAGIDSPIYTHGLTYFLICTYTCAQNTYTLYMSTSYTCTHTALPSVWYEGSPVPQPKAISLHPSFCAHWAGGASVSSLDSHALNSQTRTRTGKAIATLCLFSYK